jgi:NAD+ kinase
VSSDIRAPLALARQSARRDECIVHQFFESQRRASSATTGDGPVEERSTYGSPRARANGTEVISEKSPIDDGGDEIVEPKSMPERRPQQSRSSKCRAIVEEGDNGMVGQPDQEAWTREMTKSMSELDLAQLQQQQQHQQQHQQQQQPHRQTQEQHHQLQDEVHSRTLTKKQLSDMAWGVRELSRRLSSMRIRFRVRTIFVLTKIHDQDLVVKTRELTHWLLHRDRDVRYTVYVQDKFQTSKKFDVAGLVAEVAKGYVDAGDAEDEATARADVQRRLRYWDEPMCRSRPHTFDFVITLGGDGTVLYASWLFQRIVPPVLSFALGSLGFLTKFDFDDFAPTLDSAFTKGVTVSLRLRFEGTIMRSQRRKVTPALKEGGEGSGGGDDDDKASSEDEEEALQRGRDLVEELVGEEKGDARTHRPDGTFEILNEIVVDRGPNPSK